MRLSIRFSLIAAAAAILVASQAQQVEQAVSSRLSALVVEPIPAPVQVATLKTSDSRIGSILLAQIPPQQVPSINPGQNPNTIRPMARPGSNPKRNPVLAQPAAGAAGTPAPKVAPSPTTPPPAVATPPSSSPVAKAVPGPAPTPPPAPNPSTVADNPASDGEEKINFDYVQVPLPDILALYGSLVDKKIIRDINLESVTFTLTTDTPLPKKDAIDFIERSLLLNGYAFIPAGEKFVKCMMAASVKPGPEHPTIYSADALPKDGEAVVTFIQPLQYLEPDDLKKNLQDLVPLHAYGTISPLPNSRGIAITENSNTIRYIIELLSHLDVEPSRTEKKTFQLVRASADDVAKALADILGLDKSSSGGSSGGSKGGTPQPQPSQPNPAGIPNQPNAAAQAPRTGVYGSAPQATALPPKIVPIARNNAIMVIARPSDITYIGTLIDELDAATTIKKFVSYPLHFVDASSVLQILGESLQTLAPGGDGTSTGGKSGGNSVIGGNNQAGSQQNNSSFGRNNSNSSFGNNGLGSQNGFGSSGGGGGGFGGGGGTAQKLVQNDQPQSLVVGKTLIIADPIQNEVFVTGPPEHMDTIKMILEELDVRPRQVVINAVIGEVNVDDGKEFGIDYLFSPHEARFSGLNGNVAGGAMTGKGGIQDVSSIGSIKDLLGAAAAGSGFSLFGTFNDQVTVALKALNSSSNFKVLSRPTIYTLNNQPASIQTGQKVPVPTGTYGGGGISNGTNQNNNFNNGFQTNINYQDVFLSLSVAPLILNENEIKLTIHQENNSLGADKVVGSITAAQINSQQLETTIMLKNNATVLLGGLVTEDVKKTRNGIPVLKDIPLIKYAFSSVTDSIKRKELLIFVNPRIVTGNGDAPPGPTDGAGSSPLGQDAERYMHQERTDPAREIKEVRRTKIGQLLHKLFE